MVFIPRHSRHCLSLTWFSDTCEWLEKMDRACGNVRGVVGVWQRVGDVKKCRTVAGQVTIAMELQLLVFATIFENGNVMLGRNGECVLVVEECKFRVKKARISHSSKGGIMQGIDVVVEVHSIQTSELARESCMWWRVCAFSSSAEERQLGKQ
ncbi:uncharacterized protein MONOS_3303 [Monocercomonoides exilis]|uniref:uncharacterized protein n=1 Tax=Monocercomonoides exilis TaxID=2049356 RepID=UPI00355A4AD5|nr:hypothetical protein MONOS_3303 [Monocercomonoides exilis]|eukprot:MONOS_3303.1-p1 / transcript=MONOS_3303.1 / gene=MONOS_3303 / organism=Monocercomonoides_exilis_PA203 / gene_product=unspecified product / transcript_product=unspecified product / location=Mono_scaffold00076:137592-138289(+) / protein_length=153 / sequence_SO=supercontig / SO=protein_coding / is_pseudo=false